MSIFTQERARREEANSEASRKELKNSRDESLQSILHTYSDGSIVQVRPQDLSNFQLAIQQNEDQDWVMADNTVRLTTVEEMQEAMVSGIAQGKAIWKNYTDALKLLEG